MRTLCLTMTVAAANAAGAAYTLVGAGACRGNGGSIDKVNSRHRSPVATEALCEADCDAQATCSGFAYQSAGDAKQCILYGPGMSGSCASPNQAQTTQTACTAVGTCTAAGAGATTQDACGTCSNTGATKSSSCTAIGGTWTAGTWTTTGVWETPEAPWTGEFYHTTHVHAVAANANWVCYDKNLGDHVGTCLNGGGSGDATNCAATYLGASTFAGPIETAHERESKEARPTCRIRMWLW